MYRIGTIEGAARVQRSLPSAPRSVRTPSFEAARAFDILIAVAALIFFAPLMLVVALAIKLQDGGPVTFGHRRIGRDGRGFRCLKFRSMVVDAEARLQALLARDPAARHEWEQDQKLRCDPRITPLGALLRRTSLDELPQFINVLRGEMSIVGPRPIITAEIARYGHSFRHYAAVRPGVTGLWQVSGRNNVTYRRRVAMDRLYAQRRSLGLYLYILVRTLPAVLTREGSY
jgi:Undecaprenyl-phosphate galactose phosphotransferase WbaP